MTEQMTQFWMPYLWGFAASAAGFALLWPLSVLRRDASLVDLWWGPGFAVFAWTAAAVGAMPPGPHGWVALGLVTIWALRMGWTMGRRRMRATEEDPRYAMIRAARGEGWWWKSLFQIFLLQAVIQAVLALPVAVLALATPVVPGALMALGVAVAAAGLALESTADAQLDRWQLAHPETLCTAELRAIIRHPNYVGEILFWTGIALIAIEAGALWAAVTPLALVFLLTRVSGKPLVEERLARHPGWAEYAARTPAFVPRFRRPSGPPPRAPG
ncbi:MAG: steroid 5-alpha reductase family enzyme [Paracoccaceae bacterium]|jgi:steroid 5-alpha reductase family enzyme